MEATITQISEHYYSLAMGDRDMGGTNKQSLLNYARKVAFAKRYGLRMVLVAVIIYSPEQIEIYTGELKQSVRVNQLKKLDGRGRGGEENDYDRTSKGDYD